MGQPEKGERAMDRTRVVLTVMTVVGILGAVGSVQPAAAQPYINEVLFNPPGTDAPNEYVELRGTASATIAAGTYLVGVEGDSGGGPGDVQTIFNLGGLTFGSNGFLVLLQNGNTYTTNGSATTLTSSATGWSGFAFFSADAAGTDIENASVTFLLITTGTTPTLSDDIDSDNNGTPDGAVFAGWTVLDSVSVLDNGVSDAGYGAIVFSEGGGGLIPGGSVLVNTGANTANYVGRTSDTTGSAATDWVAAGITGTAPNFSTTIGQTFPTEFENQPLDHLGSTNFVGVPVELMSFSIE